MSNGKIVETNGEISNGNILKQSERYVMVRLSNKWIDKWIVKQMERYPLERY
jgi:hypothetical protein